MGSYANSGRARRFENCTDEVVGAILSGWRYDISGISPDLRKDYEEHLRTCDHCKGKQRLHRTVDVLLLLVTTLSFVAFLLAALVMRWIETVTHLTSLHLTLPREVQAVLSHLPVGITISLEAVSLAGVIVSLALWALVAMMTPIPGMVTRFVRENLVPELRERLGKQEA